MKPSGTKIQLKASVYSCFCRPGRNVFEHNLKDEDQPGLALLFGHNVQRAVMRGRAPCRASASRANVGVMKHPASSVITCCGPTSQRNMHPLQDVWAPRL